MIDGGGKDLGVRVVEIEGSGGVGSAGVVFAIAGVCALGDDDQVGLVEPLGEGVAGKEVSVRSIQCGHRQIGCTFPCGEWNTVWTGAGVSALSDDAEEGIVG